MGLAWRAYLLPVWIGPPATIEMGTLDDGCLTHGESEPVSKFPLEGTATLAHTVEVCVAMTDSVVVAVVVVVSVSVMMLVAVASTSTSLVAVT